MREILFKAKRKDNNEWVYGYLIKNSFENYYIYPILDKRHKNWEHSPLVEVIPETICEYSRLTDKNGVNIFENDIVIIDDDIASMFQISNKGKIKFINGAFKVDVIDESHENHDLLKLLYVLVNINGVFRGKVIGNIFDEEVK